MAKGGKRHRKTQKGGQAPPSAWGWIGNNYGTGIQQFWRTFTAQPGGDAGTVNSNQITRIGHPNDNDPPLSLMQRQSGGKKKQCGGKKSRKGKGKKGGFLGIGAVLEQAIVPFGLLGMQQSYGKSKHSRRSGNIKTRRH